MLREVAKRGKPLGEQLKALCNQVGSYYPRRENFRLTPEVKTKFTESYDLIPNSFADSRLANRARGARVFRGAQ